MAGKMHDADLCKEIKRLEKRVEQLEHERYCHGHYVWPYQPYRPYPIWYGTTNLIDTTQWSYTDTTTGSITLG